MAVLTTLGPRRVGLVTIAGDQTIRVPVVIAKSIQEPAPFLAIRRHQTGTGREPRP